MTVLIILIKFIKYLKKHKIFIYQFVGDLLKYVLLATLFLFQLDILEGTIF